LNQNVNTIFGVSKTQSIVNIRTVLEKAIKMLGANGKNLYNKIDNLREEGAITEGMKIWAHALRLDGNKGTHDFEGTDKEARENLAFLRQFLDLCWTLPATIEAKKSNSIEK
ncbi:MAG: DUF4145 domain-containing protein, partial [Rhizobiales bacterium]|nr:DUF4145 domain-containing protein [Hyphomicrobiales bacterium]